MNCPERQEGLVLLIRTAIMLGFWMFMLPFTVLICFPWTFHDGAMCGCFIALACGLLLRACALRA